MIKDKKLGKIKEAIVNKWVAAIASLLFASTLSFFGGIYASSQSVLALPSTVAEHTRILAVHDEQLLALKELIPSVVFGQYKSTVAMKSLCLTDQCRQEFLKAESEIETVYLESLELK